MPEIPEMETYRTLLGKTVIGKPIASVAVERPKSINTDVNEFITSVSGGYIEGVSRRAKYLIFHMHGGLFLLTHMMLDGRLFYGQSGEKIPGKPDVVIQFTDGNSLYFCDLRLGFLHLLTREGVEQEINDLGIEPLSPDFTFEAFKSLFTRRRGVIKPLLMDQKLVCGIGNAYSNEILFEARLLPDRKVPSITEEEFRTLWQAIPRTISTGIRNGGYIEEPFAAWDTVSGGQNNHFLVYDRGQEPCKVCGTIVTETKLSGRWTYFCTTCQH